MLDGFKLFFTARSGFSPGVDSGVGSGVDPGLDSGVGYALDEAAEILHC